MKARLFIAALLALLVASPPSANAIVVSTPNDPEHERCVATSTSRCPAGTSRSARASGSPWLSTCKVASSDVDSSAGPAPRLLDARVCVVPYELVRGNAPIDRCATCLTYDRRLNDVPLSERYPAGNYEWDSVIDGGSLFKPKQAVTGATQDGWRGAANAVFGANRWVVNANAWLTQEAFTIDVTSKLADSAGRSFTRLYDGLFAKFALALIAYAGLWFMWRAMREELARGVTGIALMFVCLIAGIYLAARPAQTIRTVNDTSQALGTTMLGVVGEADESATGKGAYFQHDPAKRQIAKINDRFWRVFVYEPWVVGEFGFKDAGNTDAAGKPMKAVDKRVRRDIKRVLTTPPMLRREDPSEVEKRIGALDLEDLKRSDMPANQALYPGLYGGNNIKRFIGASVTLICSLVLLLIQGGMAVAILMAQYLLMFLAVIGPFVLLTSLLPEIGFVVFRNWLAQVAGVALLKTIYALALGVTATLIGLMQSAATGIGGTTGMLVLTVLLLILIYLKRDSLLNFTKATGSAVRDAAGVAGKTGEALASMKGAGKQGGSAVGRVGRGTSAPALATAGAAMQMAGGRMNRRAMQGGDSRRNRMMQRAGLLAAGNPTNEDSRGLGGRLRARGTKYRMQAMHGKKAGAKKAAAHTPIGALAILGSLRRGKLRDTRAAQAQAAATEARKRAEADVRTRSFASPATARAVRDLLETHDFTRGPFDVDDALGQPSVVHAQSVEARRRADESVNISGFKSIGDVKAAREANELASFDMRPPPPASAGPLVSAADAEDAALAGAPHRQSKVASSATGKGRKVTPKDERQRWAIIRNENRRRRK